MVAVLLMGCENTFEHQSNEFDSLIKNQALRVEFAKFIHSAEVLDLCSVSHQCVIEISFFSKERKSYAMLFADKYKSLSAPGFKSSFQGGLYFDSKYILIRSDEFSRLANYINTDELNSEIPVEYIWKGGRRASIYSYRVFLLEGDRLVEQHSFKSQL
jgi:hypothetical protein